MVHHDRLLNRITTIPRELSPTLRDASVIRPIEERPFIRRLLEHFGATPLATIDQAWAEAAEFQLYPNAAVATRVRQFWTPLIAIINAAAEHGQCGRARLKRPSAQHSDTFRWLRPAEAQELVRSCAPHLTPLVLFVLGTGARSSEAVYLQWDAVDLAAARVRLPSNDGPQFIGLPSPIIRSLAQCPNKLGHVFRRHDGLPYKHKANAGGQVKTALSAASQRAGMPRVTMSALRHTWAVWWLAKNDRDQGLFMEAGRWADPRLVKRYRQLCDAELTSLSSEIDKYFPGWFE
jgi:integrase